MKHTRHITRSRNLVLRAQIDPIGAVFLQIWFSVVGFMLTMAFSDKQSG